MRRSLLLLGATLAACAGPVDPGQSAWQGTLNGGPGGISGSVAALSVAGRTHASIALQRGSPGQQYGWRISSGDCGTEGASFGAAAVYPALTVASDGSAGGDAYLSQTMGAGPYAARVVQIVPATQTPAVCVPLQRLP